MSVIWDFIIGMAVVPVLFIGWLLVQQASRLYAKAHPELGPAREEGAGCGKSCMCASGGSCQRRS